MAHPIAKIDVLLSLISQVNGVVATLSESDKELRNSDPEKLVKILSYAYLQACKIYGERPTRKISWLLPMIEEQEADEAAAARWS